MYQYQSQTKDWLFGYLSYDLKNDTENLTSNNFDGLHFPDLYFFQPKKLLLLKDNELEIQYLNMCDDEVDDDFNAILSVQFDLKNSQTEPVEVNQQISKEKYLDKVQKMLDYIH